MALRDFVYLLFHETSANFSAFKQQSQEEKHPLTLRTKALPACLPRRAIRECLSDHARLVGSSGSQLPPVGSSQGAVLTAATGSQVSRQLLWKESHISKAKLLWNELFNKTQNLFVFFLMCIYLALAVLRGLFSSCGERRLLSSCEARACLCSVFIFGARGLSHAAPGFLELRLSSGSPRAWLPAACGIFPR